MPVVDLVAARLPPSSNALYMIVVTDADRPNNNAIVVGAAP